MKRLLIAALLVAIPVCALGAAGYRNAYSRLGKVVNAGAMNGANAFTATFDLPDQQGVWGLMTVWICVTDANDSVTAVTMSCTGSHDRGTTNYSLQDGTAAAGVFTTVNASWSKNPAAIASPKCWSWRVDIEGFPGVTCTFPAATGGAAADLLTVHATLSVKG